MKLTIEEGGILITEKLMHFDLKTRAVQKNRYKTIIVYDFNST